MINEYENYSLHNNQSHTALSTQSHSLSDVQYFCCNKLRHYKSRCPHGHIPKEEDICPLEGTEV